MAAETKITATELARNLSDVLNRVKYKGETFLVERNGEPVATLAPSQSWGTWADLLRVFAEHSPDDEWADDMARIHAEMNQPLPPPPHWPD